MTSLGETAYKTLFGKDSSPEITITYSGRLKPFNANVKYTRGGPLHFSLSKKWIDVDESIQQGCVQSLLTKIFKHTVIDDSALQLYTTYIHNLDKGGTRDSEDAILSESYERVVELMFGGFFDPCNLKWGSASFRTWGYYDFTTDTITLSTLLQEYPDLLDYVMYHEMLHKKLKFTFGKKRNTYHSKEFRELEAQYPGAAQLEKKLHVVARKHRFSSW